MPIPRSAVLFTAIAPSVTNTWEMMETISLRIKKHKKKPCAILLKIFWRNHTMNTVKFDCKRLAGRHSSQLLRRSERCRHGKNMPYRYPFSVAWACISTQPTSTEPFKNEEPLGILADERVSRQATPENPFRWTVDCTRVLFRAGHTAQGPTLVATASSVRNIWRFYWTRHVY